MATAAANQISDTTDTTDAGASKPVLAFHFLLEDQESAKLTAARYRSANRRIRTLRRTVHAAGFSFVVWVVLVFDRSDRSAS
jgi:hypothetical protein